MNADWKENWQNGKLVSEADLAFVIPAQAGTQKIVGRLQDGALIRKQ